MSRRLVFQALLLALLAWVVVQGTRDAYRAAWYAWADPWPVEAPVLWPLDGGHVRHLEHLLARFDSCLPEPGGVIAVTIDPDLGEQSFYLYLWLAYLLPEHHVRLAAFDTLPSVPKPPAHDDAWLVYGFEPSLPADLSLEPACRSDGSAVFHLSDANSTAVDSATNAAHEATKPASGAPEERTTEAEPQGDDS